MTVLRWEKMTSNKIIDNMGLLRVDRLEKEICGDYVSMNKIIEHDICNNLLTFLFKHTVQTHC